MSGFILNGEYYHLQSHIKNILSPFKLNFIYLGDGTVLLADNHYTESHFLEMVNPGKDKQEFPVWLKDKAQTEEKRELDFFCFHFDKEKKFFGISYTPHKSQRELDPSLDAIHFRRIESIPPGELISNLPHRFQECLLQLLRTNSIENAIEKFTAVYRSVQALEIRNHRFYQELRSGVKPIHLSKIFDIVTNDNGLKEPIR